MIRLQISGRYVVLSSIHGLLVYPVVKYIIAGVRCVRVDASGGLFNEPLLDWNLYSVTALKGLTTNDIDVEASPFHKRIFEQGKVPGGPSCLCQHRSPHGDPRGSHKSPMRVP